MNAAALAGVRALVTGASQGLGLEIARQYLHQGASVMMCARDATQLAAAAQSLRDVAAPGQTIAAQRADVANAESVAALIRAAQDHLGGIDVLVNNAGVYGPMGAIEDVDWAAWLQAIEVNLFGSILMCRAVVPLMKQQRRGKIIQLSGGGATAPMPNITAYAVSKAAIVRFIESLALELQSFGIDVNSVAPGALNTRMLDEVLAAGPERVGRAFYERSLKQKDSGGTGLAAGANLCVFLASRASDGITGKLISAAWDLWDRWPEHLDELRTTDVYTLRRITGRDRGMAWGDK